MADQEVGPYHQGLGKASFAAIKWNYAGTILRSALQLVLTAILARLLGPRVFGLMAVAYVVMGLGNLLVDMGFGSALIQAKTLSTEDVRQVFTLQMALGVCLALLTALLSPLLGSVIKDSAMTPVLLTISVTFIIQAFGSTAQSLLRRGLNFRTLQLAQLTGYVLGYAGIGIPMAYLDAGVWSLVVAQLTQALVSNILLYFSVRHSVRPKALRLAASYVSVGQEIIGINLAHWGVLNLDSLFALRFFGVQALGLYNRAYMFLISPVQSFVMVLHSVLFPASARIQEDRGRLRSAYLTGVNAIGVVAPPIFLATSVASERVIIGLYGNRWADAASLVSPLSLAMTFYALAAPASAITWGRGEFKLNRNIEAASLVALVVLASLSRLGSIELLAWIVFVVYAIRFLLLTSAVLASLELSWTDLSSSGRAIAFASLPTFAVMWLTDQVLLPSSLPATLGLVVLTATGALSLLVTLLSFSGHVTTQETRAVLARVLPSEPRGLQRLFGRLIGDGTKRLKDSDSDNSTPNSTQRHRRRVL